MVINPDNFEFTKKEHYDISNLHEESKVIEIGQGIKTNHETNHLMIMTCLVILFSS